MVEFYDHEVVQRAPDDYVEVLYTPKQIIMAWQSSLFAHELLAENGEIKPQNSMHEATLEKFIQATDAIKRDESIAKPIIGIGIMDNIEIGIGREIIAAAQLLEIKKIPIHMRKKQQGDITALIK